MQHGMTTASIVTVELFYVRVCVSLVLSFVGRILMFEGNCHLLLCPLRDMFLAFN